MSDTVLVTLWATSVAATLTVEVYAFTDTGKDVLLFSFPVLNAGTTDLLLKRASIATQRVYIKATYAGACDYEVYVRAISGGISDARILGAGSLRVSQADIPPVATLLIPAALTDRAGIVIKNWSTSGNLYLAESLAKAIAMGGWPLAPRDIIAMDVDAGVSIYAISDAGTLDIRIIEAGG